MCMAGATVLVGGECADKRTAHPIIWVNIAILSFSKAPSLLPAK